MLHEDVYDTVLPMVLDRIGKNARGRSAGPEILDGPDELENAARQDTALYRDCKGRRRKLWWLVANDPRVLRSRKAFGLNQRFFADVTMDMRIAKEEVFGPVLSVLKWREVDEVIEMANAIDLGLTASIWTP